jgi:predicted ATPase
MECNKQLSRILLRGFKSIRDCDLELQSLNIMIGPNGVGKSNFLNCFRLIQHILAKQLQTYISRQGGPDALLHFGRKKTSGIMGEFHFAEQAYKLVLEPTQDNRMMFADEVFFSNESDYCKIGSGHFETEIDAENARSMVYKDIIPTMKNWRLYHFHDTGETAQVKQVQQINDNDYLRPDASNLAAFLYRLKKQFPAEYRRIVKIVQLAAPFFGDFYLRPNTDNPEFIELEWTEKGEDKPFKAYQLSDGTLRFICLATVLNQPEQFMPTTILIDEPELGLHPRAIDFLAAMLRSAAVTRQVIASTQSVTLLNGFSIDDLIIVDREDGVSSFKRHREEKFKHWLQEYTVGDLWEKNVFGGR